LSSPPWNGDGTAPRIYDARMLTVGIDEVGYGPRLGPLVVAAAGSVAPLPAGVRVADSKKIFSQARGVRTLEPTVLGFLPAATFRELLARLGQPVPSEPWYAEDLDLPRLSPAGRLEVAFARLVEPAEFNARTRDRNKADLLFDLVAELVERILETHPGPLRIVAGKQGGRRCYLEKIRGRLDPGAEAVGESRDRSCYRFSGGEIEFLRDGEDRHELVALASMIGKYVRERAMELFNAFWTARLPGLRPTAGYGPDGLRFFRRIEPLLGAAGIPQEGVLRLR